ncbi:MAG: hypothetical protein M1838_005158 [Thelocarpon superellum]|nr:MAG: hypothetical protein M1838_005158 [Thelocarpon superellum]
MIIRSSRLVLTAALFSAPLALAISPSDLPADTPVSSLVSSANAHLAKGDFNDALTYFDAAIARDPRNYLTLFKRGATHLSLGRNTQASEDFDKVLAIKPDFEGALLQRAKIKSKNGDWDAAKQDYLAAGKSGGPEVADLDEAQGAAALAEDAERKGDWEGCVSQTGVAIMTATTALGLRQRRARCRFERGEVQEGINDLAHVLQIAPGLLEPHVQISSMLFYSLGDTDRGLAQIRRCLHSDPDSKPCSKLFRREKTLDKQYGKVKQAMEKRQFSSVAKMLVGAGEDIGLIKEVRADVQALREAGTIPPKAPEDLLSTLVELTCQAYAEMNSHRKAAPYCDEALTHNPTSLAGLLSRARSQLDASDFDGAIGTLQKASEAHPHASGTINPLLQKAHVGLKKSKQKDYYGVLGVSSDADARTIKRAYRKLTKEHHPDKAQSRGVGKEAAEKKMSSINEAYEVLSDPELRARFDNGDDPNSQEHQGSPFQGSPFGGSWPGGAGGQQFFFQQGGGGGGGGQGGFPGGFKVHFP